MKKHTWMTAAMGLMVFAAIGCGPSSSKPTPMPAAPAAAVKVTEEPGHVLEETAVTVAAIVVKVDQKARVVTLRNYDGKVFDLHVGDEVKNLPQVKKGDEVVVSYYESMALQLHKPGHAEPGAGSAATLDTAKPGEKPGAIAAQQTKIVATVVALDKAKGTVTLKGPQGKVVTVQAREKKRLEPVKVGDLIEATYTEAIAISVDKPTAK